AAAHAGALGAASLGVAAAAALGVVLGRVWISGVLALLAEPGSGDAGPASGEYRGTAATWLHGDETRASVRKELRSLVRSPARRSATIVTIVFGTGFLLLQALRPLSPPPAMVLLVPAAASWPSARSTTRSAT